MLVWGGESVSSNVGAPNGFDFELDFLLVFAGTGKARAEDLVFTMDGAKTKAEEEEEEVEVPLNVMRGEGLCSGKTAINLLCMIWLWSATLIDYFVINIYLKYIPGSEYLNQTIAGISEILAHIVVGYMIAEITPKGTFMVGYLLASIGGACLMFQSHFGENVFLIAFFVLFAKFGASMAMGT